jgi:hypothetical protein
LYPSFLSHPAGLSCEASIAAHSGQKPLAELTTDFTMAAIKSRDVDKLEAVPDNQLMIQDQQYLVSQALG